MNKKQLILFIMVMVFGLVSLFFTNIYPVDAVFVNTSYGYRQLFNFTNNNTFAMINVPYMLNLTFNGGKITNCSKELRVYICNTENDGNCSTGTELEITHHQWNATYTSGSCVDVWANFKLNLSSQSSRIVFVYYNSSSSAEPSYTDEIFWADDFIGQNISAYRVSKDADFTYNISSGHMQLREVDSLDITDAYVQIPTYANVTRNATQVMRAKTVITALTRYYRNGFMGAYANSGNADGAEPNNWTRTDVIDAVVQDTFNLIDTGSVSSTANINTDTNYHNLTFFHNDSARIASRYDTTNYLTASTATRNVANSAIPTFGVAAGLVGEKSYTMLDYWVIYEGSNFWENASINFYDKIIEPQRIGEQSMSSQINYTIINCTNITASGVYNLTASITNSDATSCINISVSDVVFDGNGFTIDGLDSAGTKGIAVSDGTLTNVTIKNTRLTDWAIGISLSSVQSSVITDVSSTSNTNRGIQLYSSAKNVIANSTFNSNSNYGMDIQQNSDNNNITNNTINSNNFAGIIIEVASVRNTMVNNTANSNTGGPGFWVYSTSDFNNLTNNTANSNSEAGFKIEDSDNNILINNTAKSNSNDALYVITTSIGNKVYNLDMGGPIVTLSNFMDIAIRNSTAPANDPARYRNISKWINATNTSANGWMYLNISYVASDLGGRDETTLIIARNNGTWNNVTSTFSTNSGVNVVDNYVFANITSFSSNSTFAPLASSNLAPTHGIPVLNTTFGNNRSNENLTVYNISTADAESDAVTNIINWYRNDTSIFLIMQPFDTNYTNFTITNITRDYSGNGLNGSGGKSLNSSQAPKFNNTGISGGALVFDGQDDIMEFAGMTQRISNESGAYEFWIRMKADINNSDGTTKGLIDPASSQLDFFLYKENSGENNITFKVRNASGATHTLSYAPLKQGWLKDIWHHVVVTWDTDFGVKIYDNGTEVAKNISELNTFQKISGNTLYLGSLANGLNPDTRTINATIDEFRIYNVSLTAEQVRANYNSGLYKSNLIEASMTKKNEIWQSCLIPNDGLDDGITRCSNNLTILNTVPTHGTPILNSSSNTNLTTENLTIYNVSTSDPENDILTNILTWNRNNVSMLYLYFPFDTNYSNHSYINGIRDYSGNGYNGTQDTKEQNGNINWTNGNNCKIGGCYVFNGINSSITTSQLTIKAVNIPNNGNFSVTFWLNVNQFNNLNNPNRILDNQDSGPDSGFLIGTLNTTSGANKIQFAVRNGSTATANIQSNNISIGVWYFVAVTWRLNSARLYINATEEGTTDIDTQYNNSLSNLTIGRRAGGNSNFFNGSLDELKIWNWTLTPEQIRAEYNNGVAYNGNIISSTMLVANDNWQGCITPNDGLDDGTTKCSNNLTVESVPVSILTYPPNNTVSGSKTISFVCNATDETALSNITLFANFNGTYLANQTANLSGTSNNGTNFTVSGIQEGRFIWNCKATDNSNNQVFNTSLNRTLEIDTIKASDITLINATNNQRFNSLNSTILFNITANDATDHNLTCNLTLDGVLNKSLGVRANGGNINSSSINITGIAGGTHLWNVTCFDNANNSNTSATFNFTINRVPATPSISQPPNNSYWNNRTIIWTASDSDGGDTLTYYLYVSNGTAFNTINFSNLTITEKQHTFTSLQELKWFTKVISNDGLENSSDSTIVNFTLDLTKPNILLSVPSESESRQEGNINLTYNISDANDISNCTLVFSTQANSTDNNVSVSTSDQSFQFNKQSGTYTWQVYCTDLANNVNASETRNLTLTVNQESGLGGGGGGVATQAIPKILARIEAELPKIWDYNLTKITVKAYDNNNNLILPNLINLEFKPVNNDFLIISKELKKEGSIITIKPLSSAKGEYKLNITANNQVSKVYTFNIGTISNIPEKIKDTANKLLNTTKETSNKTISFIKDKWNSEQRFYFYLIAGGGTILIFASMLFARGLKDFGRNMGKGR